jgi:putative endonuclease
MEQHAMGRGAAYTSRRLPVELAWFQEFERIDEAWACERRLHGWSRLKKLALIAGRLDLLPRFSARGGPDLPAG